MPTTASHAIPYPQGTDDATVPAHMQALAEKVDTELDAIAPAQIVGVTAGKLLIANGDGVVTGVAMSGDGTITPAGDFQLGTGVVEATELGPKAVTTAKLDDLAVAEGKLANDSVTASKIKNGEVKNAELGNKAVTKDKIAPSSLQGKIITVSGTSGTATCTWDTPMASASYVCVATAAFAFASEVTFTLKDFSTSSVKVNYFNNSGGVTINIHLIAMLLG